MNIVLHKIFKKGSCFINSRALPFLVSILPPSVFLLYLYQRNAASLSIWHILIAIAIFTLGAVIMHLVISKLVKSSGATALINNLLWILFFTIKAPYEVLNLYDRKNLIIYLCIIFVIIAIIIMLIVRYKNIFHKQIIFKILSIFWLVIFIFNVVLSFIYTIRNHSTYIIDEKNYKTEFNIDNSLPSPNIYWLLMDGMLGFKAMEHLFNDPQLEFTAQLTKREFIINRDAQYEALHSTSYCIPALMCPTYYDTYFVTKLQYSYDKKEENRRDNELIESAMLARAKNELILAFNKKGYQTNIVSTYFNIYYFTPNILYLNKQKIINNEKIKIIDQERIEKLSSLFTLFYNNTPLVKIASELNKLINQYMKIKNNFTDIQKLPSQSSDNIKLFFGEFYQGNDKWFLNALTDIMNYQEPKLVIIHDIKSHYPYKYDEHGKIRQRWKEALDPYNYPSQHYFTSTIVISYIDFILNTDPEAIIVIQADHGLHHPETGELLISKYGKTDEDVRLMQNQTISAVRIPEKWGGLEQPIEPPNITRLLINRYVGENYTLLASEDIIK